MRAVNVKIMIYDMHWFKINLSRIRNTNQVIPMITRFFQAPDLVREVNVKIMIYDFALVQDESKSHQEHKSGYTNDYTILPGSRFGERNVKIMIYDLHWLHNK